jgi:GT2 family glycosyltransferase
LTHYQFFCQKAGKWELPEYRFPEILLENIIFCTGLFRKSDWEKVNGYNPNMVYGWEDYDFWLSLIELGREVFRIPQVLFYYRQLPGSRNNSINLERIVQCYSQLFKNHPKLYSENIEIIFEHIIQLRVRNWQLQTQLPATQAQLQRTSPQIHEIQQLEGKGIVHTGTKITSKLLVNKHIKFPIIEPISNEIDRPLWSVIIPTYNGTKYLEQTLRSVLEQDPGSDLMQIEVVDDCSTQDDPEELVREIGQGRISFYRQPKNLGLIGNWNDCIKRARGHWVHILHQDDVVKFGFYKRLQAAVEKEPTIGAAFCRYFYMDEKGCEQALSPLERETPGVISNWIERIAVMQRIECPSIVVKREVYEDLGGFSQEAYYAADWEMWKRIAAHYSVWYEPELLVQQGGNKQTILVEE